MDILVRERGLQMHGEEVEWKPLDDMPVEAREVARTEEPPRFGAEPERGLYDPPRFGKEPEKGL